MQKNLPSKLAFLIVLGLIFNSVQINPAYSNQVDEINQENPAGVVENQDVPETEPYDQATNQDYTINLLRNRLSVNESLYRNLTDQEEETKRELLRMNQKIGTLEGQLNILDDQIYMTEKKIRQVRKKIGFTELKIGNLIEQIAIKQAIYDEQKDILADYLRLIYFHDRVYGDNEGDMSTVKMLLSDYSISTIFQNKNNLSILKNVTEDILERVNQIKADLELENERLDDERQKLSALQSSLEDEEDLLEIQKKGKIKLLAETENKEEIFQRLLIQTKIEQEDVLKDIEQLKTSLVYFEQTTDNLRDQLSEEQYQKAIRIKESIFNGSQPAISRFAIWPIQVNRRFSAFFHDEGYINAFGVDHMALDMPTAQGTPFRSVADGIVLKAKLSDGIGYNYIAIAHEGGLVTVYGHVFAGFIKDGDFVETGQIIGLTGGIPGTTGAGYRTTGAHLHFETHYQGERVDPFYYLPIEELSADFVPDKYRDLYRHAVDLYNTQLDQLSGQKLDQEVQKILEEGQAEKPLDDRMLPAVEELLSP